MSICKFGKQASGNLPIMLVTLGSLSRPFAYRMAPRLKQERCFQQSNCKEITSLFPKFTPKDPNRRANSLALFFGACEEQWNGKGFLRKVRGKRSSKARTPHHYAA